MVCQPRFRRRFYIHLLEESASIETKGRTVTSPFKNNFIKQESLKFTSFYMPECHLHQLLKISQITSTEMLTKLLVLCELIKFLEFQGFSSFLSASFTGISSGKPCLGVCLENLDLHRQL